MQNSFRIGLRAKTMASLNKVLAQFDEIVDLAVEDNPYRVILIGHRLVPCGEIDDAQTIERQSDITRAIRAAVVWSTMCDHLAHALKRHFFYMTLRIKIQQAV